MSSIQRVQGNSNNNHGYMGDNGKENGNYRGYIGIIGYILGLYWDNGK